MNFGTVDAQPIYHLAVSVMLGLLVGLQRQWAEARLGGVRTFSIVSLLGTVTTFLAGTYGGWIVVAGLFGVVALFVSGDLKQIKVIKENKGNRESEEYDREPQTGVATEAALLLMFCIGAMVSIGPIWIAAAGAGMLAFLLQFRVELHGLATRFSGPELKSIMQFVLISFVILPIVPDRTFGPFDVLNPHETWLMVVLIVGLSLSGYITYKFFGDRAGTLSSGLLGGLISSTATTASYSRLVKDADERATASGLIIALAWTTVYIRMIVEIAVAGPQFNIAYRPLLIIFGVSLISSVWVWRRVRGRSRGMLPQENPSEMATALIFALAYSMILLASAAAKTYFGKSGLIAVAFVSGITDLDAITLSTARLVSSGQLGQVEAWQVVDAAIFSNVIFKGALAGVLGGKELFKVIAVPWVASLLICFALFLFP